MELGKTPKEIRQAIRQGRYTGGTAGIAPGHVQANLVILPRAQAYDFLVFCQRNPRPCPLIEVTDPGNPEPIGVAPGADLRTDIPKYRIYREPDRPDVPDEHRLPAGRGLPGADGRLDAAHPGSARAAGRDRHRALPDGPRGARPRRRACPHRHP
jgi:hypothetical protein